MSEIDKDKAIEMMEQMKSDLRAVINDYATEASAIAVNHGDPHSAVIACAQIALANASVDYMTLCGTKPLESFQVVVNATGQAMQQWINTVMRNNNIKAPGVPDNGKDKAPELQ